MANMKEKLVELLTDCEAKGFWSYGTDCKTGEHGGHEMTAEDIASYLIENFVTAQEWISVADRLPCADTTVLVCDDREGNTHTAAFDGTIWHLDGGWLLDADDFTHWMPLPQPPKGE